jgi:hypothetical protein
MSPLPLANPISAARKFQNQAYTKLFHPTLAKFRGDVSNWDFSLSSNVEHLTRTIRYCHASKYSKVSALSASRSCLAFQILGLVPPIRDFKIHQLWSDEHSFVRT